MPNLAISDRLLTLPHSQKTTLLQLWRELFNTDPPMAMRKELLVQFLAYRLQENEFSELSDRSRRRIKELADSIDAPSKSGSQKLAIKPGTRLIRRWKDQVHVVNVEEGDYEYRGARYESLSEIARLITGTRWSGPLFFGLKDRSIAAAKGVA
jgi:Protein of unknown function (DUF2924)